MIQDNDEQLLDKNIDSIIRTHDIELLKSLGLEILTVDLKSQQDINSIMYVKTDWRHVSMETGLSGNKLHNIPLETHVKLDFEFYIAECKYKGKSRIDGGPILALERILKK